MSDKFDLLIGKGGWFPCNKDLKSHKSKILLVQSVYFYLFIFFFLKEIII